MSIASKLLMCVCAGGTGAAIVPVSKAVRQSVAPRQAIARKAPTAPIALAAVPCIPTVAGGEIGPGLAGLGGISPLLPLASADLAPSIAGPSQLGSLGEIGDILAGSSGFAAGGNAGGGAGGGSGGGGGTGGGGGGLPPVSSNAPEPTSWVLMIGGFGVLGGAMRYVRRSRSANPTA